MLQESTQQAAVIMPWWGSVLDHLITAGITAFGMYVSHNQGSHASNGNTPQLIEALSRSCPIVQGRPMTAQPATQDPDRHAGTLNLPLP
jgi:hypothetical protein